jgi:hypothetical protein
VLAAPHTHHHHHPRRAGKDRIELWTKTAANEALQMSLGKQLKQLLDVGDSAKIGFVVFVSSGTSVLAGIGSSGLWWLLLNGMRVHTPAPQLLGVWRWHC